MHDQDPTVDLRMWFEAARGPRAIVNNSDIRLAVDRPALKSLEDVALVVGGFGRVRGAIPLIHVARIYDEKGEPLGYEQMVGEGLLSEGHRIAFNRLAEEFRFKDAKLAYEKGSQATKDFLGKCIAAGVVKKVRDGYKKMMAAAEVPAARADQAD